MKNNFIAAILLVIGLLSYAQDPDEDHSNESIFRVLLLSPGLEFEQDITEKFSAVANVGILPVFYAYGGALTENRDGFLFPPFIDVQARYYLNYARRTRLGKSIENNSGNFVALKYSYYFEDSNNSDRVQFESGTIAGVVYGLQRTYWQHMHLSLEMGAGIYKGSSESNVSGGPIISFQLGYTF